MPKRAPDPMVTMREESSNPNQEPGCEPEVARPARGGEDGRQFVDVDLDDVVLVAVFDRAIGLAALAAREPRDVHAPPSRTVVMARR